MIAAISEDPASFKVYIDHIMLTYPKRSPLLLMKTSIVSICVKVNTWPLGN